MPARGNAPRHHVGLGSLTACAVVFDASSDRQPDLAGHSRRMVSRGRRTAAEHLPPS